MLVAFDVGETLIEYEGVALDWTSHYRQALLTALQRMGVSVSGELLANAEDILSTYNTRKNPRLVEIGSGEVMTKLALLFGIETVPFERGFFSYFQRRASPLPDAHSMLKCLREAGAYIAALSDVPYGMPTVLLIEDLGPLAPEFDYILSSCDVGFRKPLGQGLNLLLQRSGQSAKSAYYVGNEQKDIQAATSAGIQSILLVKGSAIPDYGQTFTVHSLAEVAAIVL